MTVHGADRLGIVARLASVIAEAGGNITDLTTRLSGRSICCWPSRPAPSDRCRGASGSARRGVCRVGRGTSLRLIENDQL